VQEDTGGQTDEKSKGGNHGEVSVVRGAIDGEGFVIVVVPAGVVGRPVAAGLVTADFTGWAFCKDRVGSPGITTDVRFWMSLRIW
jgi:hypothetical protein